MATKTINIDGSKAYTLLKKAVERKGADYVTPKVADDIFGITMFVRNRFVDPNTNKALCFVGQALNLGGVTLEELSHVNTVSHLMAEHPRVKITDAAREVFSVAMDRADRGYSWGSALAEAFKVAPVSHEER